MAHLDALLELQEIDTTLDRLAHRRETLPARESLAASEAAVATSTAEVEVTFAKLHELQTTERALEDESAGMDDKIAHVDRMLYGGTVTAARELEAYQADMDSLRKRVGEIDDRVLEILELVEPLEAELEEKRHRAESAQSTRVAAAAALAEAEAEVDAEVERVMATRREVVTGLDDSLVSDYEGLRRRLGGVGAAKLVGARCEGCHLEIPSAELEEIRHAPPEATVFCPDCGRILVR